MVLLSLGIIIVASAVVYIAGEHFATASSVLGEKLHLSKGVKGATLDAISSSLPELMIALFSVIAFGTFEVGVGTIAGSSLFNLLIIPAVSVLVAGGSLKLSSLVVTRDAWFHLLSKIVLFVMVFFVASWNATLALILLGLYLVYLYVLLREKQVKTHDEELPLWSLRRTVFVAIFAVALIGLGAYFLTAQSIVLATSLGVPPLLIAFTVIAAATSVPDLVVSLVNARKHSGDDALANVLGSNTFNIFVGLGLPLLIATLISGPLVVSIVYPELITLVLLVSAGFILFLRKQELTKKHAWLFFALYIAITLYVVLLAL